MAKCLICGKDSGKGRTCGSTCRKALSRSVTKGVTDEGVTLSVTKPIGGTTEAAILASKQRSLEGSAKPGDADYPEQTGLNTCNKCGCKLKYDVLDVCLPCVVPSKSSQEATGQVI
ncbi:unnamed protein product [marine sediment metagenome]|uniref:Uncharacterized protein n=1 Tax=marine sediment metagenome TaxID=412755 RepID=X0V627_9ZZZZ